MSRDKSPSQLPDTGTHEPPARASSLAELAEFLARARVAAPRTDAGRGRLIFALDATMSRQPTWDLACKLQVEMFREAEATGGLDVRLVYFRGHDECRASSWVSEAAALARLMNRISVAGGHTQIRKVLADARREASGRAVRALVFVGDAMEESADELCARAGELGLLKVPVFMFQEGHDEQTEQTYREIARLSGGAFGRFDPGAAAQLRDLLRAVAAYAAGGREALRRLAGAQPGAAALLSQMK